MAECALFLQGTPFPALIYGSPDLQCQLQGDLTPLASTSTCTHAQAHTSPHNMYTSKINLQIMNIAFIFQKNILTNIDFEINVIELSKDLYLS